MQQQLNDDFIAEIKVGKTKDAIQFDEGLTVYGLAKIDGRFQAVMAKVDAAGKPIRWEVYRQPEGEREFAEDNFKHMVNQSEGMGY